MSEPRQNVSLEAAVLFCGIGRLTVVSELPHMPHNPSDWTALWLF